MMNNRQKHSKPLTKIDVAVRLTVVVSVSLFGIGLTLDADEVSKPAAQELPVITPRKVDAKPGKKPPVFDNSVFQRLSRRPKKAEPTQAIAKQKAGTGNDDSIPAWQLDEKPAEKPAKVAQALKTTPPKSNRLSPKAKQPPEAKKRPVAKKDTTKKSGFWNLLPRSLSKAKSTLKADKASDKQPIAVKSPQPVKKPTANKPIVKKPVVKKPVVKKLPVKKGSSGFKLPAQLVSIPKKKSQPTTADKTPATGKTPAVPFRQRLSNMYSKVLPNKPAKTKTSKVVKPVTHVEKPTAKLIQTAKTRSAATKPAKSNESIADIKSENSKPKTKAPKAPLTAQGHIAVAKTTPPTSNTPFPKPPASTKPSDSRVAQQPKPPVALVAKKQPTKKTTPRRLQLRSLVGKLFPGKPAESAPSKKPAIAAKPSSDKAPAAPAIAKKSATKTKSLPPVVSLTAKPKHNKPQLPERKPTRLPFDAEIAKKQTPKKQTPKKAVTFSFEELTQPQQVKRVAASEEPIFDLQIIEDFDFNSLPPLVASQPTELAPPPAPAGGDDDEPETLGFNGFKPIGEVTVDIDIVKGENPPDLAAPEFPEDNQIVLNTEWIDQTLCAPLLPFYHQPLYFEDPNAERCGDACCLQPAVSAGLFYLTIPALPYLIGAYPPKEEVESLGDCGYGCKYKCHEAYIPRFSLKGIALQGAVTTGLIYLIP